MTDPEAGDVRAGVPVLEVDQVSVDLGGRRVLTDISFSIAAGQFIALIGTNGAGKTTLFKAVLELLRPSSGSVRVAGGPRSRRNPVIGYVPQKTALDPDLPMRARDLVRLGLDGHRFGVGRSSAAQQGRIEDILRSVGADHFADARVSELSGGEQQRVLIAHALVSRPALLLLDEPLANLDIRSGAEIVALLSRVSREHGVAVFISAHDMNPLLGVMDGLVYLAGGRAVSGSTDAVVQSETLTGLYGYPVEVLRVRGRVLVAAGRSPGDRSETAGELLLGQD
jgi:zinc/manganese transport system ATP-binding protein